MPGFGPGMPFRRTGLGGGASRLLSDGNCGAGVAFDSDGAADSEASLTGKAAGGCSELAGDGGVDDDLVVDGDTSDGNLARAVDDRRSVSTRDFDGLDDGLVDGFAADEVLPGERVAAAAGIVIKSMVVRVPAMVVGERAWSCGEAGGAGAGRGGGLAAAAVTRGRRSSDHPASLPAAAREGGEARWSAGDAVWRERCQSKGRAGG